MELQIPASVEFIPIARKAAEEIVSSLPLTPQQLEDMQPAVCEPCAKAVKLNGPDRPAICTTCAIRPENVEILVWDRGRALNRKRQYLMKSSLELLSEGATGLYLTDQLVHQPKYSSESAYRLCACPSGSVEA